MKRIAFTLGIIAIWVSVAGCGDAGRVTARDLNRFAVKCAKYEMWAEAEFRLRSALALRGDDPRLHNNLAVALEAQAKLEEAYAEYRRAVALAPHEEEFRQNLNEFIADHRWELEGGTEAED